jgi:hypothetical protein
MFLLKTLHIIDFSPKGIQKKELEGRRKRGGDQLQRRFA